MIKLYFLCCSYRTRIKDHGIIKLRIAGLDKQINHSTRICIPIADWDSKKVQVKSRNEQAYLLNKQISDLRSKIIDFVETRTKNNELISADLLKAHINGESKETKGLLTMIQYYIDIILQLRQRLRSKCTSCGICHRITRIDFITKCGC